MLAVHRVAVIEHSFSQAIPFDCGIARRNAGVARVDSLRAIEGIHVAPVTIHDSQSGLIFLLIYGIKPDTGKGCEQLRSVSLRLDLKPLASSRGRNEGMRAWPSVQSYGPTPG